ncbi:hypothetical protein [Rhizobium sp. LC145]|uniref:hypothetical protein n=1 Tax=Rhizobium sp. LC145 TaxID=1120688 RepID=UPI0010C9D97C|nr:hypothetical protein [Rhizobium sp. LC145]TKT46541.1 hypothetical protein FDR95_22000 [Rhizobiaceae bacterium LC148]
MTDNVPEHQVGFHFKGPERPRFCRIDARSPFILTGMFFPFNAKSGKIFSQARVRPFAYAISDGKPVPTFPGIA